MASEGTEFVDLG